MLFGYLTLITALAISAVAIYYSVAGLVAIFAAAALPIMIMGGTLEIAKLVTAVWLHRFWDKATWWLKTYLVTAVVVLMFITSMGIFGFLSKAHIEQTSASQESVARSQVLQQEIDRQIAVVGRAENEIRKLESTGSGSDTQIQAQIDKEQERIDNAYKRIQPAIDEQNRIIGSQAKLYQDELTRIDEQLATLQKYIDAGDKESIKKAQAMIGARQDGSWGRNTAAAAEEWRKGRQQARADLLAKIEAASNNPQARAAANEIKRLRQGVESQIAESNRLINRLRQNIGKTDNTAQIQKSIDEQNERIRTASSEIEKLTQEKITIDSEYRKLEAEVGPIKYIAEFIYGERADTNMLEEAVRWVIVVIIFVFDPLAVLLLLAAQYTFEFTRRQREENTDDFDFNEYEKDRAARIDQNQGWPFPVQEEPKNENTTTETTEEIHEADTTLPTAQEQESAEGRVEDDQAVVAIEESVEEPKKKDTSLETEESSEESQVRKQELEEQEKDSSWVDAKRAWKEDHPTLTLKEIKEQYIKGEIDALPWADYHKPHKYVMKENGEQVTKETQSESSEGDAETGYIQNGEQNENTLWKRLKGE